MATSLPARAPTAPNAGTARRAPRSCMRYLARRRRREQQDRIIHHHSARHRDPPRFAVPLEWPGEYVRPPPIFHAAMTCEIIGRAWRRPPRKVARRTDHGDLHRGHHSHGDHIGRHPVVRTDPGVELPRHDVHRRLAHRELQVHVRIRRQETSPDRRDDRRRQMDGVDRSRPRGRSRSWFKSSSAPAIWPIAGRNRSSKR